MSSAHKIKPKHMRRSANIAQFTLNVIAFNLFFAPALAADDSPFSRAPLHLLNPGQTEIVTNTKTHTVNNTDTRTTTTTTTSPNVAKPNIMLYLDNSGSMLGNNGKESVLATVRDVLPNYANDARWGVTFMNGKDTPYSWATSMHANIGLTDNQQTVRDAINKGFDNSSIYATPTIQGYITAAELLTKGMNNETRCAKNYLIVMSDGVANGGPASSAPAVGMVTHYVEWYGRYRAGFIPINAILNNTQYVKEVFPKYTKTDVQYQFLCPRNQHNPITGEGYCPDRDGYTQFVMYPYSGNVERYTDATFNKGWQWIRNNADRGKYGDVTQFPNNADQSQVRWYSTTGLTGAAANNYLAFSQASYLKGPEMMRWLSKPWEENDLRPDIPGKQSITTFTIGFSDIFDPNGYDYAGNPIPTLPHYRFLSEGASDKPGGGKWFANANNPDQLKRVFKEMFDFIKHEHEQDQIDAGPPQTITSTTSANSSSSALNGSTVKRQSYSTQTPGQVGSGLTTGYPDAMASLQLNEKLTGTELIFTKLDEFGKPIGDDEKGSYIGAKFDERRAMISKGDGTAQWFDNPTGWLNDQFGLKNSTDEYKDTLLPWIARYGTDSDIQTRAKTHNDYEVNPYRIRDAVKERNMGDVLDTGIVSIGQRTLEVGKKPTGDDDTSGRREFLLTAANDGLVYIFQNEKTANIADTPPYSLKLNYSPATMPRSSTSDTVASKFSKIAREDYSDSPDNPHLYLINGGMTARRTDAGTLDNPRERQIFMAGNMGQGARGMYAINVGGKDLKTGNPVGIDAPQTSWLTSVPLFEASAKDDSAMGYTVGNPQIARVGSNVWTQNNSNLKQGISQAVFMGSGFAFPSIKEQETALYVFEALGKDVGTDNIGSNHKEKGELLNGGKKVSIGKTGGLATPAVLDVNQDGVADYAYAGDYEGNLYRFDLRDINNISYKKLYSAPAWDGKFPTQPITAEPAISKIAEGKYVVIWGTGSDIYDEDFDKTDVQGIFGIHQRFDLNDNIKPLNPMTTDNSEEAVSPVQRSDLLPQTLSFISSDADEIYRMVTDDDIREKGNLKYAGWYVPLNTIPGERVVVKPDEVWGSVAVYTRFYKKQAGTSHNSHFVPWNENDPLANGWTKVGQTEFEGKTEGEALCLLEKDQDGNDIKAGPGWSGFSPVNGNGTPNTPTQSNHDPCATVTSSSSSQEQRTCQYTYTETDTYKWSKVTPYTGGSAVIQLRAENGGRIIHKKNIGFKYLLNGADIGSYLYNGDAYISSKMYPDSINTISIFSQNIKDFSINHAGQYKSGDDETLGEVTKQPYNCLQGKPNLGYVAGSEGYRETVELGEVYCESPKTLRRISWREIF